ncbi:hypothetical protein Q7C36_019798 [Tachysurus vachellii]|uniref:Uncharacterized protein n=1 Tax=Tachysurus vachellii TaxID=175792 RepID=A0AA88LSH9_TACVA|nr:hypothetical protein Q7C36_019798 [Tachysurus vachellii]
MAASHRNTWIQFQSDSEGRGLVDQENEVVYLFGDLKVECYFGLLFPPFLWPKLVKLKGSKDNNKESKLKKPEIFGK